jgi:hypothetical protein
MTARILNGQPLIEIDGKPTYIHGVNYAWFDYGDFGLKLGWGKYKSWSSDASRVSRNIEKIDADFARMARDGATSVRWFLFTDGNNGIDYDRKGNIAGLNPGVFEDIDAAIEIARTHHVRIAFSLLDFIVQFEKQGHPEILGTARGRRDFVEKILRPLLKRYGENDTILSWEVMNEPDAIIAGMDPSTAVDNADPKRPKRLKHPLKFRDFVAFSNAIAREVHELGKGQLVTVGGKRAGFLEWWTQPALGLDHVEIHLHEAGDDTILMELLKPGVLGRPLPVIVGEAPGMNDGHKPPRSTLQWCEWGLHQPGLAGLRMWAITPDKPPEDPDEAKTYTPRAPYDRDDMRVFTRRHPEVCNSAATTRARPAASDKEARSVTDVESPETQGKPETARKPKAKTKIKAKARPKSRKHAGRQTRRMDAKPEIRDIQPSPTEDQPAHGIFYRVLHWRRERKAAEEKILDERERQAMKDLEEELRSDPKKFSLMTSSIQTIVKPVRKRDAMSDLSSLPTIRASSKVFGSQAIQISKAPSFKHAAIPVTQTLHQSPQVIAHHTTQVNYTRELMKKQNLGGLSDFGRTRDTSFGQGAGSRVQPTFVKIANSATAHPAGAGPASSNSQSYQLSRSGSAMKGLENLAGTLGSTLPSHQNIKMYEGTGDCFTKAGAVTNCSDPGIIRFPGINRWGG